MNIASFYASLAAVPGRRGGVRLHATADTVIIRLILLVFLCGTATVQSRAAGPSYTLEVTHDAYQPLEGATPLNVTSAWDWDIRDNVDPYAYIDLGTTTFRYMGTDYTFTPGNGLGVSVMGNLKIAGTTSSIIIDPFFTALDSVAPGAQVLYRVDGTPGNYVVAVEWRGVHFDDCPSSSFTNFQIRLYQSTGAIEMHYGESSVDCDTAYWGDTGPLVGLFRGSPLFDKVYEICWLTGSPAAPAIVGNRFEALKGTPVPGTVYRLVPVSATSVAGEPGGTALSVTPNPLTGVSTLAFELQQAADVRIVLCDLAGREHRVLAERRMEAGVHELPVGRDGLAAGVYLLKVHIGEQAQSVSLVVE